MFNRTTLLILLAALVSGTALQAAQRWLGKPPPVQMTLQQVPEQAARGPKTGADTDESQADDSRPECEPDASALCHTEPSPQP